MQTTTKPFLSRFWPHLVMLSAMTLLPACGGALPTTSMTLPRPSRSNTWLHTRISPPRTSGHG